MEAANSILNSDKFKHYTLKPANFRDTPNIKWTYLKSKHLYGVCECERAFRNKKQWPQEQHNC